MMGITHSAQGQAQTQLSMNESVRGEIDGRGREGGEGKRKDWKPVTLSFIASLNRETRLQVSTPH